MPFISNILETEIRKINDEPFASFEGFPKDVPEAADRWATAIDTFASSVIPASTTASAAKSAFASVMQGVSAQSGNGLALLSNALTAYAGALAGGMTGAGFIGVPPPAPIILDSISPIGLGGGSGADVAAALATLIDTWFKTGLATPIAGGAPVPWI